MRRRILVCSMLGLVVACKSTSKPVESDVPQAPRTEAESKPEENPEENPDQFPAPDPAQCEADPDCCMSTDECAEGQECFANVCLVRCSNDAECGEGEFCDLMACNACPKHIDCMPPIPEGQTCPPAGIEERCPGIQITY